MKSAIYSGRVMHRRLQPFEHGFASRLYMTWLDLSELDEVFAGRWFWSTKRRAWSRFQREDHLGDPNEPLDESVRKLVRERLGARSLGPVRLLTNLRVAGIRMNPVSFFFCYSEDGHDLEALVAEVTNTPWDETHAYVLDLRGAQGEGGGFRVETPKAFHVSPFMPMDQRYVFTLGEPGDRLGLGIESRDAEGQRVFTAALSMQRREIGGWSLARVLLSAPFLPMRIVWGIYWQALRLKLKGARFHGHPGPPVSNEAWVT